MAEEQELTVEEPQPTAEAIKQRKKREKSAAKNAALGVEKFTVEVAGVFKPDLKRVMAAHGFNNQQEVYQNLLRNLIAADFETQAWMLRSVTTPYEPSEKVSLAFYEKSMAEIAADPGDEVIPPI
jgi:alpha-beta hydrolase superfamily lysophospholipase